MKSIKSDKPCEPTITYPCLMEGKDSGVIILFQCEGKGTIVYKSGHGYDVGYSKGNWGMSFFKPYNGSVCLEN